VEIAPPGGPSGNRAVQWPLPPGRRAIINGAGRTEEYHPSSILPPRTGFTSFQLACRQKGNYKAFKKEVTLGWVQQTDKGKLVAPRCAGWRICKNLRPPFPIEEVGRAGGRYRQAIQEPGSLRRDQKVSGPARTLGARWPLNRSGKSKPPVEGRAGGGGGAKIPGPAYRATMPKKGRFRRNISAI